MKEAPLSRSFHCNRKVGRFLIGRRRESSSSLWKDQRSFASCLHFISGCVGRLTPVDVCLCWYSEIWVSGCTGLGYSPSITHLDLHGMFCLTKPCLDLSRRRYRLDAWHAWSKAFEVIAVRHITEDRGPVSLTLAQYDYVGTLHRAE